MGRDRCSTDFIFFLSDHFPKHRGTRQTRYFSFGCGPTAISLHAHDAACTRQTQRPSAVSIFTPLKAFSGTSVTQWRRAKSHLWRRKRAATRNYANGAAAFRRTLPNAANKQRARQKGERRLRGFVYITRRPNHDAREPRVANQPSIESWTLCATNGGGLDHMQRFRDDVLEISRTRHFARFCIERFDIIYVQIARGLSFGVLREVGR